MISATPFGRVLADLLTSTGYVRPNYSPDWPKFARQLEGVSYETLRKAVTGEREVSEKVMRIAATALHVEPTVFVEYRFTQARRELNPDEVGWPRAMDALVTFEQALASKKP